CGRRQRKSGDELTDRSEAEISQERTEARLGPMQVAIVTETRDRPSGEARLFRIDFPRVQIEHRRALFDAGHAAAAPARPAVGQDAEVAAAADRQVHAAELYGRSWNFEDRAAVARDDVRMPRRRRDAVAIVMDRVDARVVAVPFVDEHVERPQRPL